MSDTKTRAIEIYLQHIALASTDGTLFRRTVMTQLKAELGVTQASAATHYNTAKKLHPVEGLGRQGVTKGARRVTTTKAGKTTEIPDDNECFTVIEIVDGKVGRTQGYLMQGDASEAFDSKVFNWPKSRWVMIRGLGPNPDDDYELSEGEEQIRCYDSVDKEMAPAV